jgi:hypothetical protein
MLARPTWVVYRTHRASSSSRNGSGASLPSAGGRGANGCGGARHSWTGDRWAVRGVPDGDGECASGFVSTAGVAMVACRDERRVSGLLSPAIPVIAVNPMLPVMIVSVREAMARVGRMDRTVRPRC